MYPNCRCCLFSNSLRFRLSLFSLFNHSSLSNLFNLNIRLNLNSSHTSNSHNSLFISRVTRNNPINSLISNPINSLSISNR